MILPSPPVFPLPSGQSSLTFWLFHHYPLRHSCLLADSAADFAADSAVVGMLQLVDLVADLSMA